MNALEEVTGQNHDCKAVEQAAIDHYEKGCAIAGVAPKIVFADPNYRDNGPGLITLWSGENHVVTYRYAETPNGLTFSTDARPGIHDFIARVRKMVEQDTLLDAITYGIETNATLQAEHLRCAYIAEDIDYDPETGKIEIGTGTYLVPSDRSMTEAEIEGTGIVFGIGDD